MEHPIGSRLLDLGGKQLYIDYRMNHENRPTLVFLHDSLGCVQLWRDFPERLATASRCNVLVYDRLGYGKSGLMPHFERETDYMELEAADLDALLTTLNIKEAILFGHSDGGSIALLAASKYPTNIKAVVLEAAHVFVEEVTLKGIREAMADYASTDLPQRLAKYHGDKVDTLFKAWTLTWTREDFKDWNIESFLSDITCPLLFIQGEMDEYGSPEQVEKTIRQVGGKAEKYMLANVKHTPHKEAPDEVIEKVVRYLEQIT